VISSTRTRIGALEADLQHIVGRYNTYAAGPDGSVAGARYQQLAVDAVRVAATCIQADLDDYNAFLRNRAGRLDSLGYGPPTAGPTAPTEIGLGALVMFANAANSAGPGVARPAGGDASNAIIVGGASGGAVAGPPGAVVGVVVGTIILIAAAIAAAAANAPDTPPTTGTAPESAERTTPSINQAQKAVERGQAPNGIKRFDKGDPQLNEKPHVHLKDGGALNQDGTWKHGPERPLTKREREFLTGYGWTVPE
jgi:hypothetical protein